MPGSGGAEGGYQPPYDSSMVGLVCPRCSVICRGVAELQVNQWYFHIILKRRGALTPL